MINKKLDYNTELMLITMEECGELIEACSKTIRCEDYVDDEKMIEEVGDVLLMIDLMDASTFGCLVCKINPRQRRNY